MADIGKSHTPHILPDLLGPGQKIVFCGTAAGAASAAAGAYYAGRGNRFWPTLYAIGLTTRQLRPSQFRELLQHGIGLTDLAKTASGADTDLPPGSFDIPRFSAAIAAASPRVLAFNGIRAARAFLGAKTGPVGYGVGLWPVAPCMPSIAVLPSTAGLAARYWSIEPWQALADHIAKTTA